MRNTYHFVLQIHVHGSDLKSLHKEIDSSVLPQELGGKLGPAAELAEVSVGEQL